MSTVFDFYFVKYFNANILGTLFIPTNLIRELI